MNLDFGLMERRRSWRWRVNVEEEEGLTGEERKEN